MDELREQCPWDRKQTLSRCATSPSKRPMNWAMLFRYSRKSKMSWGTCFAHCVLRQARQCERPRHGRYSHISENSSADIRISTAMWRRTKKRSNKIKPQIKRRQKCPFWCTKVAGLGLRQRTRQGREVGFDWEHPNRCGKRCKKNWLNSKPK